MPLHGLHHYTLRPVDLEATKDFYVELLGLEVGYRPPLAFPGYWLYTGGEPTVHLIGPRESERGLPPREAGETGLLDHIAFSCTGLAAMKAKLAERGVAYEERVIPRDGQVQLFLKDPNGVAVELNYPGTEGRAAPAPELGVAPGERGGMPVQSASAPAERRDAPACGPISSRNPRPQDDIALREGQQRHVQLQYSVGGKDVERAAHRRRCGGHEDREAAIRAAVHDQGGAQPFLDPCQGRLRPVAGLRAGDPIGDEGAQQAIAGDPLENRALEACPRPAAGCRAHQQARDRAEEYQQNDGGIHRMQESSGERRRCVLEAVHDGEDQQHDRADRQHDHGAAEQDASQCLHATALRWKGSTRAGSPCVRDCLTVA